LLLNSAVEMVSKTFRNKTFPNEIKRGKQHCKVFQTFAATYGLFLIIHYKDMRHF
jgi:hypothetical protein